MEGIVPCPYCDGEVEMVKLKARETERDPIFRIECRRCHQLVARGYSFPIETKEIEQKRIAQYEEIMKQKLTPMFYRYYKHNEGHTWLNSNRE